jgi:hypothetical protein
MSLVDERGRLFGRFNLVDAAVIVFVAMLIPIGYATYLLFRPSKPTIDSVTRVEITKEERRIANGGLLTAKLKVRGSGFNPLLRAWIGGAEAMGFVFESPNSADVLVGMVPTGTHDLVLFDGVQEVARATGAVSIQNTSGPTIRAVGWFTNLTPGAADELKPGFSSDKEAPGAFEVVAAGAIRPAHSRINLGPVPTDIPIAGQVEREAVVTVRCDWPPFFDTCSVAGQSLRQAPPVAVSLPGPLQFQIHEILPITPPRPAVVELRLTQAPAELVRTGDRDAFLDGRAATIRAVGRRDADGLRITLELGVDDSREGWRYRGQLIRPGSPLSFVTDRYAASGYVVGATVAPPETKAP